jgi:hypothetical protein
LIQVLCLKGALLFGILFFALGGLDGCSQRGLALLVRLIFGPRSGSVVFGLLTFLLLSSVTPIAYLNETEFLSLHLSLCRFKTSSRFRDVVFDPSVIGL